MLVIYLEFTGITMASAKKLSRNFPPPYCPHFQLVIAALRESPKPCSLGNEKPALWSPGAVSCRRQVVLVSVD